MSSELAVFNIQRFSVHDGDGVRTTIFLKGCPLKCPWCANPECNLDYRTDKIYTQHELLEIALKDKEFYISSGGGVTLSGGEPLQSEGAAEFLKLLAENGINTCVETSGYVEAELFESALPYINKLLFDFKHPNSEAHRQIMGVDNVLIIENAKRALRGGVDVTARIPVIKGVNDSEEAIEGFADQFEGLGINTVHLLPFHQFGEKKWEELGLEYSFKDVPGMRDEELADMARAFENRNFTVQIGG